MDNIGYPLLCRWGGKIVTQGKGVDYEGGQIRALVINYQMSFNALREKVCNITGIDRALGDVELLMRYPTFEAHVAVPLDDEYSLKAVWAHAKRAPSLELYVKHTQEKSSTQVFHPSESQSSRQAPTQLPDQVPTQVPDQVPAQLLTQSSRAPEIGLGNRPNVPTCDVRVHEMSHKRLDIRVIGRHYKDMLEANPGLTVAKIIELVKKDFQCTINDEKALRAKEWGLELIFGKWEKSFEILSSFMQALQRSNPGTIVEWCLSPTIDPSVNMFKRVFWAFKPSIDGFKHCRPLMTIDSSHLEGKYMGFLFIANGIDANNRILPLAFAVVESDNEESWSWFMKCIRNFVTNRTNLCVISDGRLGIIKAMNDKDVGWAPPLATHRLCIRHLTSHLVKEYKVVGLESLFQNCAYQCHHKKFIADFNKIGELTPEGHRYLSDIGLEKWSIYHDGGQRYGFKTTNMVQSFKHVLKGACSLPITALVEMTFYRVNKLFVERRELSACRLTEGYAYSPYVTEKIKYHNQKAQSHMVIKVHDDQIGIYEVYTGYGNRGQKKGGHKQTVNLTEGTCTCNKLQIYKFPCSHLLTVFKNPILAKKSFVDSFYSSLEFYSTYSSTFWSIGDKCSWEPYQGTKIMADSNMKRDKGR